MGGPPHKTEVEGYNGSAWATQPSIATGRSNLAGSSTASSGVVFGGDAAAPVVYTGATEEFTGETTASNIGNFSTS